MLEVEETSGGVVEDDIAGRCEAVEEPAVLWLLCSCEELVPAVLPEPLPEPFPVADEPAVPAEPLPAKDEPAVLPEPLPAEDEPTVLPEPPIVD